MNVIACAVHLYQLSLKVRANFGEDMPKCVNRLAVQNAAAVFGQEDQMDVHGEDAVSTVPKVPAFVHRPEYTFPPWSEVKRSNSS